jgi:mono/diheme cytochrome c family protein
VRRVLQVRCLIVLCVLCDVSLPLRAQTTAEPQQRLPAPASRAVDFSRDVKPILQVACVRCHARGNDKGGFSIETRESLLKGGDTGPAAVPGQSADSFLIALVAGLEPDMVMPKKGSRLTGDQVALLRAWIDQGAVWDPGVTFARSAPLNLTPRAPALPEAAASIPSPVNRLLKEYFAAHNAASAPWADDRQLIRRLTLDVLGVLPTPVEVRAFVADRAADKRQRLVARLLADDRRYAEHWLSFWNDLLRNDYRGVRSRHGSTRRWPITCRTTSLSLHSSIRCPAPRGSPRASSGAASSMPVRRQRCRPRKTSRRSSWA